MYGLCMGFGVHTALNLHPVSGSVGDTVRAKKTSRSVLTVLALGVILPLRALAKHRLLLA